MNEQSSHSGPAGLSGDSKIAPCSLFFKPLPLVAGTSCTLTQVPAEKHDKALNYDAWDERPLTLVTSPGQTIEDQPLELRGLKAHPVVPEGGLEYPSFAILA